MAKRRKKRVDQDEVVRWFAARLREVRAARGMTQAELARRAQVTTSYVWRLETGGAAPGIDLVARLAVALGTTIPDLLPDRSPADPAGVARDQARALFAALIDRADAQAFALLNPFLALLTESTGKRLAGDG